MKGQNTYTKLGTGTPLRGGVPVPSNFVSSMSLYCLYFVSLMSFRRKMILHTKYSILMVHSIGPELSIYRNHI